MTDAVQAAPDFRKRSAWFRFGAVWPIGLVAAAAWAAAAAAVVTVAMPDVVRWGSTQLFATIVAIGAVILALLAVLVPRIGQRGRLVRHYGPWFVALGVWFTLWELTTAKFGWLPKPFFSPPQGLLNVYVSD